MPKRPDGIPATELSDEDLERELRQLYKTREDTFFGGSADALQRHTDRMAELENESLHRRGIHPDPRRTREGSRARAGQST